MYEPRQVYCWNVSTPHFVKIHLLWYDATVAMLQISSEMWKLEIMGTQWLSWLLSVNSFTGVACQNHPEVLKNIFFFKKKNMSFPNRGEEGGVPHLGKTPTFSRFFSENVPNWLRTFSTFIVTFQQNKGHHSQFLLCSNFRMKARQTKGL